ncbi:MAG: ATP-binding protein [Rhodanobacter sp.]
MKKALLLAMAMLLSAPAFTVAAPTTAVAAPEVAAPVVPLSTPQFRRYGIADGLPSTSVYAVAQDPSGAIWLGTKGGLARFDGVHFQVFRHSESDPGSLHANGIGALMVDRGGHLWAAGLNAGLNRYDAATGKFSHWTHNPADPASLSSDRVWVMAQTADGAVWVGTSAGLDRMHADGHGFDHVMNPLADAPGKGFGAVVALYVDARQQLWIGTDYGVFRRDASGQIHRVEMADPKQSMDMWRIEGDAGEVRIATAGGLVVVGKDGLARRFATDVIPRTNVMSSARDAAGRLWIGTQRGLFVQAKRDGSVAAVSDHPVLAGNLPGTWVWQVFADREGGLWVGLLDGGLAYLAPDWNEFSRFTHVPDDASSLRDAEATTMARGKDGRHVWVGERGGKVDRLDPATGQVEHVISGLRGDVVGMTEDVQRRLWVAVQGALYRYDNGRMKQIDPTGDVLKRPLEVEPGVDGQMYARTFGHGIFRIDPKMLAVVKMPMDEPNDKVLWGSQMTLHNGTFWYASDGGMMRLSAAGDRFEMVPGGPQGTSVDAFAFTPDGVWMANADGLTHYRYHGDGLVADRRVGAAQGWPSASVVDLHVDANACVWIFGHDGLWRFDPKTGQFRTFGLRDGLANGDFSRGFAHMPGGYIYAATLGGVVAFDPDAVSPRGALSPLSITTVRVRRDGVVQSLPLGAGPLHVGWTDQQLAVEARLFSYVDPALNRYRFQVAGFDHGWVDTGNRGARDLAGLGAGNYTLEVMAASADGRWVKAAAPLLLQVQAPPWARWWAWLIYAALLALVVWLLLSAWRRRLAQRHRIQLIEQRQQLAEHASAAKSEFLATLSHEIRTPMTGVMGMAELLLSTPLSPQQYDYTQAMQRSGGMLMKLLNDSLDLARIEAGRLELELAPFDPRQLLGDVAQLAQGLARAKGIRFVLNVAADVPAQLVGDGLRIKQVLLNLTNNALKFTEHGSVTLCVQSATDGWLFSVSDTGPGIPEASQARLFQRFEQEQTPQRRAGSGLGLAICRELVSMMGGSIELESRLGHGSTFRVHLPFCGEVVAPESTKAVAQHARYELLLVEDDVIVAAVIRGLLEQQGHAVRHVVDGLAALVELDQHEFDAMLLDLDLPGIDGFQVARLIRQRELPGRRLPIVAVTARAGASDEVTARAAGMDGFLRKPVTGEELALALTRVVSAKLVKA